MLQILIDPFPCPEANKSFEINFKEKTEDEVSIVWMHRNPLNLKDEDSWNFQILIVSSRLPLAIKSEETSSKQLIESKCPSKVWTQVKSWTFQILIVLSSLPLASNFDETSFKERTQSVCPSRVLTFEESLRFQI